MSGHPSRPITKEGFEALSIELDRLIKVERPKIIQAISEAAAHGDLSENAEYSAAKESQAILEKRILQLSNNVVNSEIIDISQIKEEKVVFGATVSVVNAETEEKTKIQIVGEDEADVKQGKISIKAPLAKALIGKYVDDEVEVTVPGGLREYVILAICYQ
jgi:transcription elongation factor GreA